MGRAANPKSVTRQGRLAGTVHAPGTASSPQYRQDGKTRRIETRAGQNTATSGLPPVVLQPLLRVMAFRPSLWYGEVLPGRSNLPDSTAQARWPSAICNLLSSVSPTLIVWQVRKQSNRPVRLFTDGTGISIKDESRHFRYHSPHLITSRSTNPDSVYKTPQNTRLMTLYSVNSSTKMVK